MVLLDAVLEATPERARARLCLSPEAPQVEDDGAAVSWALEILAQTAAFIIVGEGSSTFRQGRLIHVKRFHAHVASLPASVVLESQVTLDAGSDSGVFLFHGQLSLEDKVLASAELTLFAS